MTVINSDIGYWIVSGLAALWIMLPAYVPNSAAALFGGGRPIDLGRAFSDGRRIFGDGKTYRGFFGGVLSGVLVGLIEIWAATTFSLGVLPRQTFLSVTLLATGALLGDLAKSFLKRRLGKERGESWFLADQYDLVVGSFLLLLIFDPQWLSWNITLPIAVWIIVMTPLLHRVVNIIGYYIGVKEVPW
ncbi:Cytidylyltransferase family protein [Methanoculleus chikugoensis]|uniref:CDP-archaeol synthase n=2 Tax=Methanoculleus chikugoensis TaxID=118126 RepID=A0A1M4MK21_9EURY|nr:CDP-2,3-bis-(O-geranylgeranyl)-sn-glycerol synthase [Methanomicrobiales archaeon]SCL75265.1 Cytidylyltransferase family protein [Methanoculleus chikugoensis]